MQFSVLMSVYKNETVDNFKQAMDSVINQTVSPDEIVLVRDGEVYEKLQEAIDEYLRVYPLLFTYIPLEENGGLGNALRIGLNACRNELVARMDTDDVCVENRFEKQIDYFKKNSHVDIVGGYIAEFRESVDKVIDFRCVPTTDLEIKNRMKDRCPFNHQTVMFKKNAVIKAGNYEHFYLFEDYYLWLRMLILGANFGNLDENLCYVRISNMSRRRGGMKYFKSYVRILKFMKQNRVVTYCEFVKCLIVRFCVYVLCPNKIRESVYRKFLRDKMVTKKNDYEIEKQTQEV